MKYLVIGAGGTGACIAGFLAHAGKDVTLIARGSHLDAIRSQGLVIRRVDDTITVPLRAMDEEEYTASLTDETRPDVIFVCVKGYSLETIYPLLEKSSRYDTIIIPILNIYGTGDKMSRDLTFPAEILNGCIYIAGSRTAPGEILMSGKIFRIVYGRRDGDLSNPKFQTIAEDLKSAGIDPVCTDCVQSKTLEKFSFVSPMAATGAYFDSNAGDAQHPGQIRDTFCACVREIQALAKAMDIPLPDTLVEQNLKILDDLAPACTASMQKDLAGGGQTEMDGLIFEVVRLAAAYGISVPTYEKIAAKFGFSLN